MSYNDAISYLYGLQKHGIKLGLEKTAKILSIVGDPQNKFRAIHVAGTNGKGSVSAITASIVTAHGHKTGLFTSPHLVSFTERIRINNVMISEHEIVALTDEIRDIITKAEAETQEELVPTFFEFVTAMAFLYFSRSGVDWVVVETGMGGRLDATSLINPAVSVITRIGYDHREFLGDTLSDIAHEKAGIIKRGVPVITVPQEKEAGDVIENTARDKTSPLFIYGRDFSGELVKTGINVTELGYKDDQLSVSDLKVPLAGEYQVINASLAIRAASIALNGIEGYRVRDGLLSVRWPGRLETVCANPLIMIDGAHNPDAASALSDFIKKYCSDYRIILVMGIMSDKDVKGILQPLLPVAAEVIFTAPDYGRAASPEQLSGLAAEMRYISKTSSSVKNAIEMAKQSSAAFGSSGLILITGSFYTIGEAKEVLGEKAILGKLRETL